MSQIPIELPSKLRYVAIAAVVSAGLALSACRSVPPGPQTWKFSGHELVERKCGSCHAVDMADISPNVDARPLRDVLRRYPIDGLEDAFARGLEIGHYDMPRFTLVPAERGEILAYLKRLDACAKPSSDEAVMRRCFSPMAGAKKPDHL